MNCKYCNNTFSSYSNARRHEKNSCPEAPNREDKRSDTSEEDTDKEMETDNEAEEDEEMETDNESNAKEDEEIDDSEISAWFFILKSASKRLPSCQTLDELGANQNKLIKVTHILREEYTALMNIFKSLKKGRIYSHIEDEIEALRSDRGYSLQEAQMVGWENHKYLIKDLLEDIQSKIENTNSQTRLSENNRRLYLLNE